MCPNAGLDGGSGLGGAQVARAQDGGRPPMRRGHVRLLQRRMRETALHLRRSILAPKRVDAFSPHIRALAMLRGLGGAVTALVLCGAAFAADPIVGPARVVDGDTIHVAGTRIRLLGLDAPEHAQLCTDRLTGASVSCGMEARRMLSTLLGHDEVSCLVEGEDRYGRLLARCQVHGQDVGAAMVRSGWALAFVRYSHAYEAQEAEARAAGTGLWATHFIPPWAWRKASH